MTNSEAIAYIREWLKDEYALNDKDREVLNMAAEALEQEPKTRQWMRVADKTGHFVWECKCGWQQQFNTSYCPDCGAKMTESEK